MKRLALILLLTLSIGTVQAHESLMMPNDEMAYKAQISKCVGMLFGYEPTEYDSCMRLCTQARGENIWSASISEENFDHCNKKCMGAKESDE